MSTNLNDVANVLNATANVLNGFGTLLNGMSNFNNNMIQPYAEQGTGFFCEERNYCLPKRKKKWHKRKHQPNCKNSQIQDNATCISATEVQNQ